MLAEIREAGKRLTFLMDYAVLQEDDLKLNNQTFNWPARMDPIFDVAQHKISAKRELAENKIKER